MTPRWPNSNSFCPQHLSAESQRIRRACRGMVVLVCFTFTMARSNESEGWQYFEKAVSGKAKYKLCSKTLECINKWTYGACSIDEFRCNEHVTLAAETRLLWCRTTASMLCVATGAGNGFAKRRAYGQHAAGVTCRINGIPRSAGVLGASIQTMLSSNVDNADQGMGSHETKNASAGNGVGCHCRRRHS